MKLDTLIHNVHIADGGHEAADSSKAVRMVGVQAGKITAVLAQGQLADVDAACIVDGQGGWLTPGLIDCHTHLVYGGNRAAEFAERLRGVSYQEIARRGGGILSTVAATRAASEQQLFDLALPRLKALAEEGVCTVEIKSGYGLDVENELKMLRVARRLGDEMGITVAATLLAAHALPPECAGRPAEYIDLVCEEIMPAVAAEGLADAVDVFCESIAFNLAECERVFDKAVELGLSVKGHVEQLSDSGGAALVARYGGLSVDHIEYLAESDLAMIRKAGCVAVLLPGAFYSLGETRKPPVQALRDAGIAIAVGTDLNPGSSPLASLLLNMNMASTLFGLTAEENLAAVTEHAAAALGLVHSKGRIASGFDADLVLWDIADPAELSYGHKLVQPTAIWRAGHQSDVSREPGRV